MGKIVDYLCIENVVYGKIKGDLKEIKGFYKRLAKVIYNNKAKEVCGSIVRVLYSDIINGEHIVELELWVPLDKKIENYEEFKYIDKFELENFALFEYKGDPRKGIYLKDEIDIFFKSMGVKPIPPAYNHSFHTVLDNITTDDMCFKVYLKFEILE